jgi:Sulfotransferase family
MKNPYVFVVGCPRSGTTLLQRLLDAHPNLAISKETHWIPKWYEKRRGITSKDMVTPELISRLVAYHRFPRWPMERKDLEQLIADDKPVSYADFVTGFFDLFGKNAGKRLVGDKTPEYVRYFRTLHGLWPEAKFVHIIRDGRDVCLSVINWKKSSNLASRFPTWQGDRVTTIALWWEWLVSLGRKDGETLGTELYHEVRYEALVSNPAHECERICAFLNIPYDDTLLRFHEDKEINSPGLDAKKAWRPVTSGLRNWQSQMPAEDVERFEAAVGNLLDDLGYTRAVLTPSAETLERVLEFRERFIGALQASGQRLPEPWKH